MLIIDTHAGQPIYEQIYRQIRDKILSGEWNAARKLPSSRQLADHLEISRNTVEQAYQQLSAEGYLYSKARSGYYVEKIDVPPMKPSPLFASVGETSPKASRPSYPYDFRYGKLDYRYVPFKILKQLMSQCFEDEMDGIVSYSGHQGESGLRTEIAKYLGEYRGVHCLPEQIVVGAGTLYCLSVVGALLRTAAPVIGFEDPGYGKARSVLSNAGFTICPVGVESDGINVRELANTNATAVYVTPSHQFPTGAILSISKRLQLIDWAIQKQAVIIEDDYSCHFRYNVRPVPALQGLNPAANVVYLGNFSKNLLPSLRVAFMVLPPTLLETYRRLYQNYNASVPYLYQKTLEKFMRKGDWTRHLRRVLQVYKKKHDYLLQMLSEQMGSQIEIGGKNAGLFITVKIHGIWGEQELIQRAAERGVRVYPLSEHWARKNLYDGKTVLLGYSSLDFAEIEEGVKRLRQAWFGS